MLLTFKLCDYGNDETETVASLQWAKQKPELIAIGTSKGDLEVWDTKAMKKLHQINTSERRIASLTWNGDMLYSGTRDGEIQCRDIRDFSKSARKLIAHEQEVGVKIRKKDNGNIQIQTSGVQIKNVTKQWYVAFYISVMK